MKERFALKETFAWITADEKRYIEVAKAELKERRADLERFVRWQPYFAVTLDEYPIDKTNEPPEIVLRMIKSASKFGIGPMSAVAGTLAEFAVAAMRDAGATYAMVDNGGDVALITDRDVLVGIYAGESPFSNKIALKIRPSSVLLGICTSSGTVGHSLSYGGADAVVVLSESTALADAAATAIGNRVNESTDIIKAIEFGKTITGLKGLVIIMGDKTGVWGDVKLCRTAV